MAYYIIDKKKIKSNIDNLRRAFVNKGLDFQLFYSVKTNFCYPVLAAVQESGSQYEILSNMEWEKVKIFNPTEIVLNGPNKNYNLVKKILEKVNLLYFNVDNDSDLDVLTKIIPKQMSKIKIGLRVYLNTIGVWNRFGYDIMGDNLIDIINRIESIKKLDGFHFHFSTNNFKISNYENLLYLIRDLCSRLNLRVEFLDIGGGLPAANEFIYESEVYRKLPSLISLFFPDIKIISEAGRNIVADTVSLEAKVISLKKIGEDKFQVNIDTNIMHFPCHYEKKYWIEYIPKIRTTKVPTEIEIFGNSCMQIDKISDSMIIEQHPRVGDKIIIHNIGAYSYSQAAKFVTKVPQIKTYE